MKLILFTLIIFLSSNSFSKDYFWIGDYGDWKDESHWSFTSGGESCGALPTSQDDVIFDANSFTNPKGVVTFGSVKIGSFTYNSNSVVSFTGNTFELSKSLLIKSNIGFTTDLIFSSNDNQIYTINIGKYTLDSDLYIKKGNWELLENIITTKQKQVNIECESFKSNGYSISTGTLIASKTKLNITGSHIETFQKVDLSNVKKVGGNPIFYSSNHSVSKFGKYKNSITKDATVNCSGGLVLDLTITSNYNGAHISCNGANDGVLSISASGTAGGYSYQLSPGAFGSATTFSGLGAGSYTVIVTDSSQVNALGNFVTCAVSDVLIEPFVIILNSQGTSMPNCPGECSAIALTNPSGGTGLLTSAWDNGETTANPVGLCPGVNNVTITDINSCTVIDFVTVIDLPAITFDLTVTPPTCNGDSDAEILISNEAGGNNDNNNNPPDPWVYNFSPVPSSGDPTLNPAVSYSGGTSVIISVFDKNGCQQDSTIQIIDPPILTITAINPQDVGCFGFCNGELTALPVGGVAPYSFEWFDNATGLTTGFTDSIPTTFCEGDYFVEVTDAFGCVVQSPVVNIGTPTEVLANAQVYPENCVGDCDGAVDVDPSGGTIPYTYQWTTFPGGASIGGTDSIGDLCPGEYQIIVFDANLCESTPIMVEVLAAIPLTLNLATTNPSCFGLCDGTITANAGGGDGNFTYNWVPNPPVGQGTNIISNLCGEVQYTVTVTDGNSCTIEDNSTLTSPPEITFDVTITPPTCNGDSDAEILISNENGGTGTPYTYFYNPIPNNGQGSNPATGYSSGFVIISVFDNVLCQQDSTIQIIDPPILTITAINPQDVNCFGVCNGELTALPVGGVAPYSFEWFDNATGLTTGFTDSIPTIFCEGDYFVEVTDALGCVVQSPVVNIGTPTEVLADAQAYALPCFNICEGAVDVDPSGGTPGYTYQWTTVPGGAGIGATDSISGLCEGQYQIIVFDVNLCPSNPVVVDVLNAPELTLALTTTNPSCYDVCNGSITANANGGAGGFLYNWVPIPPLGQGTNIISNLCSNIQYTVTVTDANNCTITDDTILISPPLYDITTNQTDLFCFGDANGAITVTVNSGASGIPYSYVWAPGNPTGQGTNSVTDLTQGNYSVTISDGVNCDTTMNFTITAPPELIADASVISHVLCNSDCNGSAQVTITGGTPNISISWNDLANQTTSPASNLCAGNYTVTLTDDNLCTATDNITINEPSQFDVTTNQTTLNCFGDCDATATVNVISGGTPNYTINWNDPLNQVGPTATLCAGNYNATLIDQAGCDSIFTFTIVEPDELTINITVDNHACFGTCTGEATITTTGGVGVFNYEWYIAGTNVPLGINNTNTGQVLCPGDYYAIFSDDNCSVTSAVFTINELDEIVTNIVSTTDVDCNASTGSAEINAVGGAGGFIYTWTPAPGGGQGTTIGTGLAAGVYNVNILDASGCEGNQGVVINSIALEVLIMDSTDVSCFGICDGSVSLSVNCLEPPCIIEWFDNLTGLTTNEFGTNPPQIFCAGEYLALLTNNLGCVTSDTIEIGTPPEIIANVNPIMDEQCFNACDGSATVTASGGEGNLSYTWNPNPGAGQSTTTALGLCAGNWDVTVTDDSSCFVTVPFVINAPNEILINNLTATDITCFGDNDGTVTILASGGTGSLSVEWFICGTNISVGMGANFGPLAPGDYYAVTTDQSGCSINSPCVTIGDKNEITATINTQNSSCFGDCNGVIDVVPSGGNGVYFYQWLDATQQPIIGQTNDTISNICQGTYFIEILDGNNCSIVLGPIDMTEPNDAWNVTSISTNENCFGACNGQAEVIVNAGNNPPYTYLWNDPNGQTTSQTTNTLCAGDYSVVISDAGVCDTTVNFTILEAPAFNLSGNQTDINCFGECTGTAMVNPMGGNAPYSVSWTNGDNGNNASLLCVGNVTATIIDDNGCSLDTTFIITEPTNPLVVTSVFNNDASCGDCNGSATVNISGGTPGYTYDWLGSPTGDGTNSVSSLCSGIISVNVTDDNGCLITENIPISDVNAEDLVVNSIDASCYGVDDGSAEVVFVCSDPGCVQEWFDATTGSTTGETSINLGPVAAGNYFIQVTNASGCISIENVTISSPTEILSNEIINEITCAGDNNASIVLSPSGGSGGGYTYVWNPIPANGNGTNTASGIGAGLWSVVITDGSVAGCFASFDFTILDTTVISIVTSLQDITCNGANNGAISTNVTGGYGSYTYQWFMNGVPMAGETMSSINGLSAGNYNVEVTDLNGCVQTLINDVTVSEPFSISAIISSTDIDCNGNNNGTINLNVSGGTPNYIINWYDASNTLIGQTGPNAVGLSADDYYAIITDDNNCSFTTATTTILETSPLTFTINSNNSACFGVCSGNSIINVSGGTPNYQYEWLDVVGNVIPGGTLDSVFNLCEGNYTVEVNDDNGCTIGIQNVVIGGFTGITANVFSNDATCGFMDGNASVFANGGNPGYSYQWQDGNQVDILGETNSTLLNVGSGNYFVVVTDQNMCTETFPVTISDLPTTSIVWDLVKHPECYGGNNGAIEVTVTGVSLPLSFVWNPDGQITEDISALSAGNYILQVTDALGCVNFYDTTLVEPDEIIITPTVTDSDCDLCNGDISINLLGGVGVLTSVWNNGSTGTFIDNLCPSVYQVTVTDGNGCTNTEAVTVNNNSGLIADATVQPISCFDVCDGGITINATGGTVPYTYNWLNNGSINSVEANLCAGNYIIEVIDSIGCISPIQVNLANPNQVAITNIITPPTCGNNDGGISITSNGGILPHTYLWSTGDITPVITNQSAGIYTLDVTEASGCTQNFIFTLNNSSGPEVNLQANALSCNGDCNGLISSNIGGGTPTYTQQWFDENGNIIGGETNPNLPNQCAGIYTIEVTDNAGCIVYETIELEEPDTTLLNTPLVINPSCFGDCNGSILVNPIGGSQPFTFAWSDPNNQNTIQASNLCDGGYEVTITDNNGCLVTQTDTLNEPIELVINIDNIIDATCVNATDGSIDVTLTGGTVPYSIQWTNSLGKDISTTEDLTGLLPMDYYISVTDANGCTTVDTFTVDTILVVLAYAGNDTTICFENSLLLVGSSNQINADYTWYDVNTIEISDTNELNIPNHLPSIETYVLEVSFGGCTHTDTVLVTTQSMVFADAGPDLEMLLNETQTIGGDPTNNNNTTVIWSPETFLSDTISSNPNVIKPDKDIWYIITVTDTNGCIGFDSVYVEVIPSLIIPDGISPNGDGKNDTWELGFAEDFPDIEISVYNRWGELLFYDNNGYPKNWDGKFKGEELPVGSYYYVIDIHHELYPKPFTGPLTIMR